MKKEYLTCDIQETVHQLKLWRSGWANDIREGWICHMEGTQEIDFTLFEVAACLILSLEDLLAGRFRDKMALVLVKQKLENLVNSDNFKRFDRLGQHHLCGCVTSGTKHHIRVMLETLEILTTN